MAEKRQATTEVGILLIDDFAMMSFACVIEPLRAANFLAGRELYRWQLLAPEAMTATASNGIAVATRPVAASDAPFDTVLICAAGNPTRFRHRGTLGWLRRAAKAGSRIGGVSGAPFIMARAGLLAGRRATIHWEHVPAFREAFPEIELRQTLFEIDAGRMTCGGGVAALDLLHALIELDQGAALAAKVSDWFLQTEIRGGSGLQRLAPGPRAGSPDRRLNAAIAAIEATPESRLSGSELAATCGLSRRQLERLFRAGLAMTPAAFQRQQRLERAHVLLTQSDLSILEVALANGFATASHFSRAYRAQYGQPPSMTRRNGEAANGMLAATGPRGGTHR
jgi:transcriptional regulator GlxA family with amidase domain